MGSSQSTHAASEINQFAENQQAVRDASSFKNEKEQRSMSGRKEETAMISNPPVVVLDSDTDEDVDDDWSATSFDSSDEEEDEEEDWNTERRAILQDAQNLKQLASNYLQPELGVQADAYARGRNYFDRPSAERFETAEEQEERELVLEEAAALKAFASHYLQPEKPVESDAFACGRNFFTRPSAPEHLSADEEVERAQILQEAAALKTFASHYLQPEKPVESDAFACGRNYFDRPSAEPFESEQDAEERDLILQEAAALKMYAGHYLKPELPVESDAFAAGRNYFSRPSAERYESEEDQEERELILQEAQQLKTFASHYLQPEKPVESDAFATGRNYFSRPSAELYEDEQDAEERELILQEAQHLKTFACHYLQPELPVQSDAFATGRNFFSRPSAEPFEDEQDAEERELVLQEAAALKTFASHYLQPELPVESDACATGRNYFSRPSAEPYEDEQDAEERAQILEEAQHLKTFASHYLQPELPVQSDAFATGRNFFSRPSAEPYEDDEEQEERERVLEEAKMLKTFATHYLKPELPVEADAYACGRNFFDRPSAERYETLEEVEERERILEEAAILKQMAKNYLQPELPVKSDGFATGRNYFTRPSAEPYESPEEQEERERILEEASMAKQLAVNYLQPELPVKTDEFACGRNYFSRASAEPYETAEEQEERDEILKEAASMKQMAENYLKPELPVKSDGFASGRNYFDRPSAAHGHKDHIHSYPVGEGEEDFEPIEVHHTNYYYQHHHHDDDHHSHGSQSDHFEMDEDQFHDFREQMMATEPFKGEHPKEADEEEEEGKLSRSPSSVMLFDQGQEAV